MGLFDKKKKGRDDFGSPVEQIDLSSASAAGLADPDGDGDEADSVDRPVAPAALRVPTPAPSPARATSEPHRRSARASAPADPPAPSTRYGIEDAVALMRSLPSENIELVVQVVKHTLESAHIDIGTIIQDAAAKQERTESRVAVLRDAIEELEREIDTRRTEIAQLEAENRETTRVKERLILAEKLSQGARPDTVVDAPTSPVRSWPSPDSSWSSPDAGPPPTPAAAAPARSKPPTVPPPTPGSTNPTPAGGSAAIGNPSHSSSGNHIVSSPVGPGGPVGSSSAVGPGGPAGSYSKSGPTHTVISKK
ncbi:MAG TPA: hypothetical protein VK698_20035 [Kofleriaceae bacterium]|nr:hypothetical protein [Kofleriaceae bacterium]